MYRIPDDFSSGILRTCCGLAPFVLGWDVSGVVEAAGFGVTLFQPGDGVFGMLPYPHGAGSHAEYVTGPPRAFALKPAAIDHVQAGALPLVSLTAWQIAKALGAYVIGTASAGNHEFLRGLGADELIDYRTADFAEAVRDVDVVLDTIGGDTQVRSLRTLRRGGVLLVLLPLQPEWRIRPRKLT